MTRPSLARASKVAMTAIVVLIATGTGWITWITRDQRPALLRGLDSAMIASTDVEPVAGMHIPDRMPQITRRILATHPIGSDGGALAADLAGMGFSVRDAGGGSWVARFDSETSLLVTWTYVTEWRQDPMGRIMDVASDAGGTGP